MKLEWGRLVLVLEINHLEFSNHIKSRDIDILNFDIIG